jgi:hypothetical protein
MFQCCTRVISCLMWMQPRPNSFLDPDMGGSIALDPWIVWFQKAIQLARRVTKINFRLESEFWMPVRLLLVVARLEVRVSARSIAGSRITEPLDLVFMIFDSRSSSCTHCMYAGVRDWLLSHDFTMATHCEHTHYNMTKWRIRHTSRKSDVHVHVHIHNYVAVR